MIVSVQWKYHKYLYLTKYFLSCITYTHYTSHVVMQATAKRHSWSRSGTSDVWSWITRLSTDIRSAEQYFRYSSKCKLYLHICILFASAYMKIEIVIHMVLVLSIWFLYNPYGFRIIHIVLVSIMNEFNPTIYNIYLSL